MAITVHRFLCCCRFGQRTVGTAFGALGSSGVEKLMLEWARNDTAEREGFVMLDAPMTPIGR